MKLKCLAAATAIVLAFSCGNSTSSEEAAPNAPGVENSDGNIPDSAGATNLNAPLPIDSSRVKDSAQ